MGTKRWRFSSVTSSGRAADAALAAPVEADAARSRRRAGLLAAILGAGLFSCSAARSSDPVHDPVASVDLREADLSLPPCRGLGCFVANCPAGTETTVVGRVTAPNGEDPIRDALVYVPSGGAPEEFPPQVACEVCSSPVGGRPVALTAGFAGHEVFFIVAPDTVTDSPSLELALRISAFFQVPVEVLFSLTPFEPLTAQLTRSA